MAWPIPNGIVRVALAALCLSLVPAAASAQTSEPAQEPAPKPKPKKKATRKPAAKPAAKEAAKPAPAPAPAAAEPVRPAPAPRAAEAPAPRAHVAPRPPPDPAAALVHRLEVGGAVGLAIPFESGINTGFKLNAAGFYGFQQVAPNMLLQLGGNLGWTYHGAPAPVDGSFMFFDFLPTARLRMTLNDKLFAYGDGGLGLAVARASVTIPFFGTRSSTDAALLIKLGGGVGYDLNPQLSLVGEPALCIYVKDGSTTELTLMVGALYRP
jgi:hypothetical protein